MAGLARSTAGVGRVLIGWSLVAGLASATACGGSEPEPTNQYQAGTYPSAQPGAYPAQPGAYPAQPGAYPAQPGAYPAQPGTYPAQPAATAAPTAAPSAPPMLIPTAQPGSPATQMDPSAGAIAQPLLASTAAKAAPGANPVGGTMVGMFQPGQQLETVVQLQPNKCYTVIAVGLPAVTEINVQLVAAGPTPALSPVLAQDQTTGPQAILGEAPNCYKQMLVPISAKVITTVAAGQGIAAVQVYEK